MSKASSSGKRCLYAVLELSRDCKATEIRSAYRRLALERHPDKIVRSGVPEAEATAAFQELVDAYKILFDPRERAWYDSHRIQVLPLSRKSRRAREEENKKRKKKKKARRELNETVRGLAEIFVVSFLFILLVYGLVDTV